MRSFMSPLADLQSPRRSGVSRVFAALSGRNTTLGLLLHGSEDGPADRDDAG
jgi:hypothetical protein